ncbi:MAG: hypothetical protein WBQ73_01560 [Candidatus Babeliales bacterium]
MVQFLDDVYRKDSMPSLVVYILNKDYNTGETGLLEEEEFKE